MNGQTIAVELLLQGRVQGLGVRPAILRLATELQLKGFVTNTPDGVLIHVEGTRSAVDGFLNSLSGSLPPRADLGFGCVESVPLIARTDFQIQQALPGGTPSAQIPLDLAVCSECRRELSDPADRRAGYAFSSCTNCGPRYSILHAMPYERDATSMDSFLLCSDCRREFSDASDRRLHAQTMACPNCGPQFWFETAHQCSRPLRAGVLNTTCPGTIAAAARIVCGGGVLALKGLGGFQLICDATNEDAVQRLRQSKHRPGKPLAVMVASCDAISRVLTNAEVTLLNSPENPIVLLEAPGLPELAAAVNPGLNSVGVFLPTTPLHVLLLNELQRPLVVTSANSSDDPLLFQDVGARALLASAADGVLFHDRRIERPVDDSVVRIIGGAAVTIRAARGLAPLRLSVQTQRRILAVGGDQKVACAISNGRQTILGPHIGDMSSLATRGRFTDHIAGLSQLYDAKPDVIAHDLHPDYFTTRWAAAQKCRTIAVQHHHAHIVSGMIEHGWQQRLVLGVAMDGTGLGTDGTIWGGEFLLATTTGFQRVASLRTFLLPGGERAVREPWRVAVSLLAEAMPELSAQQISEFRRISLRQKDGSPDRSDNVWPTPNRIRQLQQLVKSGNAQVTSSMGRLFDGIAALVLGIGKADYEAELAMRLESLCDQAASATREPNSHHCSDEINLPDGFGESNCAGELIRIDWRPLVRRVVTDLVTGVSPQRIARDFHQTVADWIAVVARHFPEFLVVLSGGCFQNRVLTEATIAGLREDSREVVMPRTIPLNDGGLAAGQIAIAAALLQAEEQYVANNQADGSLVCA